jgi:hypothetical protein
MARVTCSGWYAVENGDAVAGQDVQSEVTAGFDPLIVLLGQDGPDQADQGARGQRRGIDSGATLGS